MRRIPALILIVSVLALFIAGCSPREIEENQVYVVSEHRPFQEGTDVLNIEGRIPFQKYAGKNLEEHYDHDQVLLTVSPDGEELYLMAKSLAGQATNVILGNPKDRVKIIRKNLRTNEQEIIVDQVPFVSKVVWHPDGELVAFGGGERLTVYDAKKHRLVMEKALSQETISNFYWAPDSQDKLYTEQPELANASIYYLSSQRKVEAYETREETYYKGKLDHEYYYGTKWDFTTGQIETVILDKQRNVIKTLAPGRFKDAYQKALLLVKDSGFGLVYIEDINRPEEAITLTDEYVYDAKFVVNGKIAYTTKTEDTAENTFFLNIADRDGKRAQRFTVPGGSLALSPDGSWGYVNGPEWQKVNFLEQELDSTVFAEQETAQELAGIYAAVRGGITTYYDYKLKGAKNWTNLERYFVNTENPDQWAYFDMQNIFQAKHNKPMAQQYALQIETKNCTVDPSLGKATCAVRVSTRNVHGTGTVIDYTLELVQRMDDWYITGISTFPDAEEREIIRETVQNIVQELQHGTTLYEELAGQTIRIGQIQFWTKGMNYFAPMVESADAVKVFLYTGEREEIYKLVLEKTEQMNWKFSALTTENLSSL